MLDAGSGPGRFTLEMLRLGAHVTALDISPGQLELLRARVPDIEAVVGDITDLSRFPDDTFDVTVCFGGPLSYVVDRAERAVAELARVTRPGGHLLVSVMGLAGAVIHFAPVIVELARRDGPAKSLEIARTGFLPEDEGYGHLAMRMYLWEELEELLAPHGEVVEGVGGGRPAARRGRGAGDSGAARGVRGEARVRPRLPQLRRAPHRRPARRVTGKKLVIYLVAEPETPELAQAAVEGGADIVELGFPFSDPLAEGPVIRRASERALARGMRTHACLDVLARTRELLPETPLVPMTYAAILEAYGYERFATDARERGASSFILVDLPVEEQPELRTDPARRPDLDRGANPRGCRGDRRLALPRLGHRDDRRPDGALARAAAVRAAGAGRQRRPRRTWDSGSRRRSSRAPPPSSPTASSSGRAQSRSPRTVPTPCADFVASLRAALDS